jgi:hypothetical protein
MRVPPPNPSKGEYKIRAKLNPENSENPVNPDSDNANC